MPMELQLWRAKTKRRSLKTVPPPYHTMATAEVEALVHNNAKNKKEQHKYITKESMVTEEGGEQKNT